MSSNSQETGTATATATPTVAVGGAGAPKPVTVHAHNKTQRARSASGAEVADPPASDHFRNLLDESARDAFTRPWHRLERGLRLNRLRMYVEQMAPQCSFTNDEKIAFFGFLQRALDRKLLNTHKIVNYIPEEQRIESIRGLEVRRSTDGQARWGFTVKKTPAPTGTRRKKKEDGTPADDAVATPASTAPAKI
jgi:hypothetical protein